MRCRGGEERCQEVFKPLTAAGSKFNSCLLGSIIELQLSGLHFWRLFLCIVNILHQFLLKVLHCSNNLDHPTFFWGLSLLGLRFWSYLLTLTGLLLCQGIYPLHTHCWEDAPQATSLSLEASPVSVHLDETAEKKMFLFLLSSCLF